MKSSFAHRPPACFPLVYPRFPASRAREHLSYVYEKIKRRDTLEGAAYPGAIYNIFDQSEIEKDRGTRAREFTVNMWDNACHRIHVKGSNYDEDDDNDDYYDY